MNARDELVDVIAEALAQNVVRSPNYGMWDDAEHQAIVARSVLAALVERYGEPMVYAIEPGERIVSDYHPDEGSAPYRRLVFPWQTDNPADVDCAGGDNE